MKTFKILLTTICLSLLFTTNAKAQDDANCGFIIDGVKADSITCWYFKDCYIVFPINEAWKKYDRLELTILHGFDNNGTPQVVQNEEPPTRTVSVNEFWELFSGQKYGAVKASASKNDIDANVSEKILFEIKYSAMQERYKGEVLKNNYFSFEIKGLTISGYKEEYDQSQNAVIKLPIYDNAATLYRGKWIQCKYVQYLN